MQIKPWIKPWHLLLCQHFIQDFTHKRDTSKCLWFHADFYTRLNHDRIHSLSHFFWSVNLWYISTLFWVFLMIFAWGKLSCISSVMYEWLNLKPFYSDFFRSFLLKFDAKWPAWLNTLLGAVQAQLFHSRKNAMSDICDGSFLGPWRALTPSHSQNTITP